MGLALPEARSATLGVAREGGGLSAHAWLELGQDLIIVGEAQAPRFTRLVEFGGERA